MRLRGTLYEITNIGSFVQEYMTNRSQPGTSSVSPVPNARVILDGLNQPGRGSAFLVESNTDGTGRFDLDVSMSSDMPVFLSASGRADVSKGIIESEPQSGRWYRSSPFVPHAVDGKQCDVYVARVAIPREAGFSQPRLTTALAETKKEVANLEWIKGKIKPEGITLSCGGKGATASGRVVLNPDTSADPSKILHHTVEEFRLELPWLVGLVVSKDTVEASLRAGLADLVAEVGKQLRLSAIRLLSAQLPCSDPTAVDKIVSKATLSFSHLEYEAIPADGQSKASCTIVGEACFGFPGTLESADARP
ncbi:protein of unknown function [Nitrospira japonica]|uniref:Uncharacterized protein n=1 Tax=Nitrospira japonica TaxID=1325564 RepID=A0A1W1I900_9BACT|nr:hypothetical protein [Nitrospira japonica]SLM49497.1 protein of unknown function [Nitrospira japonica]